MRVKAVIFDLDNTLVDFMKMKREAVEAAARAMVDNGLEMSVEETIARLFEVYDKAGIENQEVFDLFMQEKFGRIDHRLLAAGIVAYRRAREAHMVLYPHVKMTLMQLIRRGYKLAVLSDAPARQAWLRLAGLNLLHYFDTVITHDDTGEWKPHPAPFRKVLEVLELEPRQVMMVGDWPDRDIAGARDVGIRTALAIYGSEFDIHDSGADFELESVEELLDVLNEVNEGEHPGLKA
jgi:putative hydrolase of the HAD superfamily